MTGASHTLEGFINAMSLEERSLRIITQIEYSRIIGRDWKIEEEELTKLIFEFSPKGISEKSIAKMYLERQRRFAGRAFGVEFKPKVTSSGAGHDVTVRATRLLVRALVLTSWRDCSTCGDYS